MRTLCLAWKEIPDAEYESWSLAYHTASTSLDNRAEKVSQLYEQIETDLHLVGSTAIEDKLQDGVPECIATLAKANIKIWVLTGDKQETAINIGYSCQLLTSDMDVFTIEATSDEEMIKELQVLQDKVQVNLGQNINGKEGFASSIGCALVINGQSLVYALSDKCEKLFVDVACLCKAVICCRVTPGQKKAVVDVVKLRKKAITLAVGDGANDVSMIKCKFK